MPELSPVTHKVLVESLDKPTLLGNPLDVEELQRINPEGFDRCLENFFQEPKIDMLGMRLSELSRASDKRVFILSRATEPPAQDWYDKLMALRKLEEKRLNGSNDWDARSNENGLNDLNGLNWLNA